MNIKDLITAENVNLTNSDRELINISGFIQPHGILFVLSAPDLEIICSSDNTESCFGITAQKLLGQNLSQLFKSEYIAVIQNCLQADCEQIQPLTLLVDNQGKTKAFHGLIHQLENKYLILELEPDIGLGKPRIFNFYNYINNIFLQIQKAARLPEFIASICQKIRQITDFDRVIIYQLSNDNSGVVIAEDKAEQLESYLGWHYLNYDIFKQEMYNLHPLRLIPDVNYQPVGIIANKPADTTIDLNFSIFRSVSPMQIEYLQNMGIAAFMSIALVKNHKLWGLILCHHHTARFVPYKIRTVCEFLGQVMSLEINRQEEKSKIDDKLRLKSLPSKFIDSVAQMPDFDELAAINRKLNRSNQELDAFTYIASHDLKLPLRGIQNYAKFLLKDYSKIFHEDGVSQLEALVQLTKRMEDLINALLEFSHLGRQEMQMELIDSNDLLKNVCELLTMSHSDNNLDIRIPQTLPKIRGDRILLEAVFTNLITNGWKYNDSPQKWVEVGYLPQPQIKSKQVQAEPTQPVMWTFYVRDNGIGICEQHLDKIFGIFKRLHAPGKYGGGVGAGLTIVKKIIERHGGNIWVESTSGAGSTFYFTLSA